jgi:hypothetical protein
MRRILQAERREPGAQPRNWAQTARRTSGFIFLVVILAIVGWFTLQARKEEDEKN